MPAKNVSGGNRRIVILARALGLPNGTGGYWFDVNPKTVGAAFELKPGTPADVDVFFYDHWGDAGGAGPAISGQFSNEDANGEAGFVPENSKVGVVYNGPCAQCASPSPASVAFTYAAEKAPVITVGGKAASFGRIEVHAGGLLRIVNPFAEEVLVRSEVSVDDEDTPLFGSTVPGESTTYLSLAGVAAGEHAFIVSGGARGVIAIV